MQLMKFGGRRLRPITRKNLGATKKLELKKKATADKNAEEKEKKIIAEI
jgi:hypothetical protein